MKRCTSTGDTFAWEGRHSLCASDMDSVGSLDEGTGYSRNPPTAGMADCLHESVKPPTLDGAVSTVKKVAKVQLRLLSGLPRQSTWQGTDKVDRNQARPWAFRRQQTVDLLGLTCSGVSGPYRRPPAIGALDIERVKFNVSET